MYSVFENAYTIYPAPLPLRTAGPLPVARAPGRALHQLPLASRQPLKHRSCERVAVVLIVHSNGILRPTAQVLDRCLSRARRDTLHIDCLWLAGSRAGPQSVTVQLPARPPYAPAAAASCCTHICADGCNCAVRTVGCGTTNTAAAASPHASLKCHCRVSAPHSKPAALPKACFFS